MVQEKFIKCFCSRSRLSKSKDFSGRQQDTEFNFSKCECRVDGKRVTKIGVDRIKLDVIISRKKGFEAF